MLKRRVSNYVICILCLSTCCFSKSPQTLLHTFQSTKCAKALLHMYQNCLDHLDLSTWAKTVLQPAHKIWTFCSPISKFHGSKPQLLWIFVNKNITATQFTKPVISFWCHLLNRSKAQITSAHKVLPEQCYCSYQKMSNKLSLIPCLKIYPLPRKHNRNRSTTFWVILVTNARVRTDKCW